MQHVIDEGAWRNDEPSRASGKLAQVTANAIAADIIERGMTAGDFLGRESDIQEQFKTSRSVLREALVILESEGVARMRRGRLGGLVVASTPLAAALIPTANYLYFCNLTPQRLLEAWWPVEDFCCMAAVGRATHAELETIEELLGRALAAPGAEQLIHVRDLRRAVLHAAGNPVLVLCELVYARLQLNFTIFGGRSLEERRRVEGAYNSHRCAQAQAVLAGDAIGAAIAARCARELFRPFIEAPRARGAPLPKSVIRDYRAARERVATEDVPESQIKRSTTLAYEIYESIRHTPPGERIGTEAELLERFKVGRGTLREAVRSLERHGAVAMESGQFGGLSVGTPDPTAALQSAHRYLRGLNLEPRCFFEAAELLFIAGAGIAAEQGERQAFGKLLRQHEISDPLQLVDAVNRQARALGAASGNSFIEFMLRITVHLATCAPLSADAEAGVVELSRFWGGLADAVEAGDRIGARRMAVGYQRALSKIFSANGDFSFSRGLPWAHSSSERISTCGRRLSP